MGGLLCVCLSACLPVCLSWCVHSCASMVLEIRSAHAHIYLRIRGKPPQAKNGKLAFLVFSMQLRLSNTSLSISHHYLIGVSGLTETPSESMV